MNEEQNTPDDPNTTPPASASLAEALDRYQMQIPEAQVAELEHFCKLLWDWNSKINLTRHTTWDKFVARDILDTLALAEFLAPGERVLDVGSGSGVPGILLGILRPDVSVSLVECVNKKAKVLSEIIHELGLPIPVYAALGQDILGNWQFHTLTFRAVASMRKLLEWFRDGWSNFDRMLLVKGPKWINERGEARHYGLFKGLALRKLKEYSIPGEETATDENGEPIPQSVVLQICPKEKLGKNDLCLLSALETSKSRNKYDGKRRKSKLPEGEVEYVFEEDFDFNEMKAVEEMEVSSPARRGSSRQNSRTRGGSEAEYDAWRRKMNKTRNRKKDLNDGDNKTNRIRNNTHRKSGTRKAAERGGQKDDDV
ncbi:MAG: 16S rRNA (guanine(527)-N(7))-methyltransferase RsmG [Planctomycetia bacterium]|nr:16S rRNA (guanine(527)-N(7))-methyltransferase RsmG [Planctomycetia bacterium]